MVVALAGAAFGAEVCDTCQYGTISEAIVALQSDLTLLGAGPFDGFSTPTFDLTITGDGSSEILGPLVVTAGLTLQSLVVSEGASAGAPIVDCYASGSLTLTTVTVNGGGAGPITLSDGCLLSSTDSVFDVFGGSAVSVVDGSVDDVGSGWLSNGGAALVVGLGDVVLSGSRLSSNYGGAIGVHPTGAVDLQVYDSVFEANVTGEGAALFAEANGYDVTVTLARNVFTNNLALAQGIVAAEGVSLTSTDDDFEGNDGGGDFVLMGVAPSEITGSEHCGSSSALVIEDSEVDVTNAVFVGLATVVSAQGTSAVTIDQATVWSNSGTTPWLADGDVELTGSVVWGPAANAATGVVALQDTVFELDPGLPGALVAPIGWLQGGSPDDAVCGVEVRLHPDFADVYDQPGAAEGSNARSKYDADGSDQDGIPFRYDCDQLDATIHGFAIEDCSDGVDQRCDGAAWPYADVDGDGYGEEAGGFECGALAGGDCGAPDADTHPGAMEEPCDGVDQDCDGVDDCPTQTTPTTGGSSVTGSTVDTGPAGVDTAELDTSVGGPDTGGAPRYALVGLSGGRCGGCATGGAAPWVVALAALGLARARRSELRR
ncbi:MAG: MopE-related protein [Myxococcota bacterium]